MSDLNTDQIADGGDAGADRDEVTIETHVLAADDRVPLADRDETTIETRFPDPRDVIRKGLLNVRARLDGGGRHDLRAVSAALLDLVTVLERAL